MRGLLAALTVALLLIGSASAAELGGFTVPDRVRMGERELALNGIGIRTATAFRVKIYVAALYLETPIVDENRILESSGYKQIKMRYAYSIDEADMRRGWEYSFEQSCPRPGCAAFATQIAQFQKLVSAVRDGDTYDYLFFDDRVEIVRAGSRLGEIRGREFVTLLLSTWIGKAPPTEQLKRAMLGAER